MCQYNKEGQACHYNKGSIETIDKMERVYGTVATIIFCELNVFKYRDRAGLKDGQPLELEFKKIKWYEDKIKSLKSKLDKPSEFLGCYVKR